jgi:putative transposase
LQIEILALRHQLNVLRRSVRRPKLHSTDRWLWILLARFWENWRSPLMIVKPETVLDWHRQGFRLYWTWKSRHRCGRPGIAPEIRQLIRTMNRANPLWGAPPIHGELLKLGINLSQASVSRYISKKIKPPSQTWRSFLDNHVGQLVSVDFFTVPTVWFQVLFGFIVLRHDRRQVVHFNVTTHPTAAWTAQQIVEAFPFETAPKYLLRDRDGVYGNPFRDQLAAMNIEQVLSAPRSPWQTHTRSDSSARYGANASIT